MTPLATATSPLPTSGPSPLYSSSRRPDFSTRSPEWNHVTASIHTTSPITLRSIERLLAYVSLHPFATWPLPGAERSGICRASISPPAPVVFTLLAGSDFFPEFLLKSFGLSCELRLILLARARRTRDYPCCFIVCCCSGCSGDTRQMPVTALPLLLLEMGALSSLNPGALPP